MKVKIQIPENCPCCFSDLIRVKDQLFCRNTNCVSVETKKVVHYAKTMKIKGLGEKTIEKLGIPSVPEIYSISKDTFIEVLGDKIGTKVFSEIESSKVTNISTFISALSIPLIGNTVAQKLSNIDSILDINIDTCKEVGIGEKATNNLLSWLSENKYVYDALPITFTKNESQKELEVTICITGKLQSFKTKSEAERFCKDIGIQVVNNLSKKVDYLISEDEKESTKSKKAIEYNIPIVTFKQLKEKLNK